MDRQAVLDSVVGAVRSLAWTVFRAPITREIEALEIGFSGFPAPRTSSRCSGEGMAAN